ncbi:hypothetical protein ACP4OV_022763 [Aristida adscensionis]
MKDLPKKQKKLLELVVSLSHSDPLVHPINTRFDAFVQTDGWLIFRILRAPLFHRWLLDPKEKCLENIRNCTYSDRRKIYESDLVKKRAMPSEASSSNVGDDEEKDPFMDKFIDFMASSEDLLTKHG